MMSYDKTAVITGAYGGLGKSLVSQYLKQGYNVHMIGRNKSRLSGLESQFKLKSPAAVIQSHECAIDNKQY